MIPVAALLWILAFAGGAQARLETLRWMDPNPVPSPVVGFVLYSGNASHRYDNSIDVGLPQPDANGVYSASLTVPDGITVYLAMTSYDAQHNESGYSNELTRTPTASQNRAPTGVIDTPSGRVTIDIGQSVGFAASASDPDGDTSLSYTWDFDELASGAGPSALEDPGSVVFSRAGVFTVRLTVTDSLGLADPTPATRVVEVTATSPGGGGSNEGTVSGRLAATVPSTTVTLTAPLGDPRLFLVDSRGFVRVVEGGAVRADPFLDVSDDVSSAVDEGLLGLAFDPDYAQSGLFYVYRIDTSGNTVVSRFQTGSDPYAADRASEEEILRVAQPYDGQKGGQLAFGADGFLYVGLGDGGALDDPGNRSQDGRSLLGKLLRLDVSLPPAASSIATAGTSYAIPGDNPFVGDPTVRDEIWALGLRDPRQFSFDRQTGDLWIADQGQDDREELDFEPFDDPGGRNYGWDVAEGTLCRSAGAAPSPACPSSAITDPYFEYSHSSGDCGVLGGYRYRGVQPELQGRYFFGDVCSGRIWSLEPGSVAGPITSYDAALEAQIGRPLQVVGFGQDGYGELYVIDASGALYQLGASQPECSDGIDNDGDGFVDSPQDPGCRDAGGEDENPICNDMLDNDGDGLIDVIDPDCGAAWESGESAAGLALAPQISSATPVCGLGAELVLLFPPIYWLRRRRVQRGMH